MANTLERIRNIALGVPDSPADTTLEYAVYLQEIRDAILGVPNKYSGGINTNILLQQIRNAILGVPDGPFGNVNSVFYLQQIRNAILGIPDGVFTTLDESLYWDEILAAGLENGITFGMAGSDTTAPTVTIASTESSPTAALPIPITFTLSEVSTDFAVGDLTVGAGSSVANFAGSGTSYTCELTPPTNAAATIDIAANSFHDAAGNGNTAATQFSITSSAFVLADDYTDTRAAGSVNGTNATPTGGARTVTDTGSKISVADGLLKFAGGAAGNIVYGSQARAAGKTIITKTVRASTDGAQDTGFTGEAVRFSTAGALAVVLNNALVFNVSTYTATTYQTAVRMRATGTHVFIKGGAFSNYTLLYPSKLGNGALTPRTASLGSNVAFQSDTIRVPTNTVALTPLASDAFTRADAALGTTGGGGSEETGGNGLTWTAQLGTWGVATNKAASSALDGTENISIATVPCGTQNIMAEVVATRSAGTCGMCLRYADADNYIKIILDGTNCKVIEVVAGTPTELITGAVTYGAANRLIISLSGVKVRAFYNDAVVGVEVTTAIATGNAHGLFTDDTGATFDNFVVWAKGTEGQYSALNPFLA